MDEILIIKTNGFLEIIESDIEISNNYIDIDTIKDSMSEYDNGIYKIIDIKICRESGQMGDFGRWEFPPCFYFDEYKVVKLAEVYSYKTKEEKQYNAKKRKQKMIDNLQLFVSSFSNNRVKYELCKVWQYDKLALREVSGETFTMFKTIHEFENDSLSTQNINKIKKWIKEYFSGLEQPEAGGEKIKTTCND